jgi:hypothetical protein
MPACVYVTREVTPHFAAELGDIFFGDVDIQVGPQAQQTAERLLRATIFLFQEVHKVQRFLLFLRRQITEFFEHLLFDGNKISRKLF